jgi:hypothetical protein
LQDSERFLPKAGLLRFSLFGVPFATRSKPNPVQRKKVEDRALLPRLWGITQDSVSRLEKRSDLSPSTLRKRLIKGMGGEVRIVAVQ